jgi:DNA-binding XRE family transcriptional regulator
MLIDIEGNKKDYEQEREARERRLLAYTEGIQKNALEQTQQLLKELVAERHRQGMTQQDIADITGILPSNIARLESGGRVPTLVVLLKYAAAVGKHVELRLTDEVSE